MAVTRQIYGDGLLPVAEIFKLVPEKARVAYGAMD